MNPWELIQILADGRSGDELTTPTFSQSKLTSGQSESSALMTSFLMVLDESLDTFQGCREIQLAQPDMKSKSIDRFKQLWVYFRMKLSIVLFVPALSEYRGALCGGFRIIFYHITLRKLTLIPRDDIRGRSKLLSRDVPSNLTSNPIPFVAPIHLYEKKWTGAVLNYISLNRQASSIVMRRIPKT